MKRRPAARLHPGRSILNRAQLQRERRLVLHRGRTRLRLLLVLFVLATILFATLL